MRRGRPGGDPDAGAGRGVALLRTLLLAPFAALRLAARVAVPAFLRLGPGRRGGERGEAGATETVTNSVTVAAAKEVFPGAVAVMVMVAVPSETAVITPALDTVAIAGSAVP